jgi:hypothetical protein
MTTASKLLLTALVSLAVGAGGTYATIHVTATCETPPIQLSAPSNFLAAPPLSPTGYPKY